MAERDLVQSSVRSKLDRFGRAIRARLLGEGLAWIVIFAIALMFASLALDYLLRLDRPLRVTIVVLSLGVLGYITWKRLIAPLLVPMAAESLALLAESRYPQLGDRLISALQFSDREDLERSGMSREMIHRMADQANQMAEPLDFNDIVEKRTLGKTVGGAGGALVIAALFVLLAPSTMGLWFQRNVLFAQVDWPQDTYLVVTGTDEKGNFTVMRGEDLEVVVTVEPNSVAPPFITLHARYETIGMTEERIDRGPDGPDGRPRYVRTFQAVAEPFEFYVTGGDDRRDERNPHRVFLIDPPTLQHLQFEVEYPRYMFRENQGVEADTGVIPVPVGSWVNVTGVCSKPLDEAGILLDDNAEPVGTMKVLDYTEMDSKGNPVGKPQPRRIKGRFFVGDLNESRTATMRFLLVDTEGHQSTRGQQYILQIERDRKPTVTARKTGVETMITAQARIPVEIKVTDDHGVSLAQFAVQVNDGNAVRVDEPMKPSRKIQREFRTAGTFDLASHPELKVKPGDMLHLMVMAEDNFPDTPNVGRSSPMTLRVVADSELMNHLLGIMKNVAISLDQAVVQQSDATGKTAAVAEFLKGNPIGPDVRRKLKESGTIEGTVVSEVIKAADQLDTVLIQMKLNRLGSDLQRSNLGTSIAQLRALEEPLNKVIAALNGTDSVENAQQLSTQATQISAEQKKILDKMIEILDAGLRKNTSRIEMAYIVKDILGVWQKDIGGGIKTIIKDQTGDIWEPSGDEDDEEEEDGK
jgi:hypothetical protein